MNHIILLFVALMITPISTLAQDKKVQRCTEKFTNEAALKNYEEQASNGDVAASYKGVFLMFALALKYCHCHASQEETQDLTEGLQHNARELNNLGVKLPLIPNNVLYEDGCEVRSDDDIYRLAGF